MTHKRSPRFQRPRVVSAIATIGALCALSSSLPAAPQSLASWTEPGPDLGLDPLDVELAVLAGRPLQPRSSQPAELEYYPNMYRRFGLSLGGAMYGNFNTTVRVDSGSVAGAILDLEDLLGVSDNSLLVRLDGYYSFSPRHRIDFGVYDIRRSGTRTIADDIQIGNVIIPAGDVETTIETLIVKAAYNYNFVADERTAIGASFGLHTMGLDLGIDSQEFQVDERFRATAPLPVVGLEAEYALSEIWKLYGKIEFLQLDLGFAKGFVGDTRVGVEYDLFDHVGLGLALNTFRLDAEIENGPKSADLEYGYQGLLLYLHVFW